MRNARVHGSRIYGASDDLIEFEGNVEGEVGFYSGDEDEREALVTCSDGTVFLIGYGKGKLAIWRITLHGPRRALEILEPIASRTRGSFVRLTPELAQRLVRLISEASGIEVAG